ncbi:MAG: RNA polymerase sigma factor [Streptomycetales bacterium]
MSRTALSASVASGPGAFDELLERGRDQGRLSFEEVRHALEEAGISPAEGRVVLHRLNEEGVRLVVEADVATGPAAEQVLREREEEIDLDEPSTEGADSVRAYLNEIGRTPLLTAEEEVDLAKRIEAGLYAEEKLRRATRDRDRLTAPRRRELEALAADGGRAKDHMLRANLRLVVSVAKKFGNRGAPFLDVVQEGNLGLIRAVEKFDYTKGYKFSTYATWWIRQAIQRGLADSARTVRLPVHVLEQLSKLGRVERDIHQRHGREPTTDELAEALGRTPDQVEQLLRSSRQPISLETPVGEDGDTRVGDLIEDIDATGASDVVEHELMLDQLRSTLATLPQREASIMALRFGLADGRPRTLDEVGRTLGLTRERIRQLEREALAKLRHPSRTERLLDYVS